jgi:hypothetical protein
MFRFTIQPDVPSGYLKQLIAKDFEALLLREISVYSEFTVLKNNLKQYQLLLFLMMVIN